jgi:hypothetical protein
MGKFFAFMKKAHPNMTGLFIEVSNAKIVYSGGPMLPVNQISFFNCVFDLGAPVSVPPSRGKALTGHLLTADLKNGLIELGQSDGQA